MKWRHDVSAVQPKERCCFPPAPVTHLCWRSHRVLPCLPWDQWLMAYEMLPEIADRVWGHSSPTPSPLCWPGSSADETEQGQRSKPCLAGWLSATYLSHQPTRQCSPAGWTGHEQLWISSVNPSTPPKKQHSAYASLTVLGVNQGNLWKTQNHTYVHVKSEISSFWFIKCNLRLPTFH